MKLPLSIAGALLLALAGAPSAQAGIQYAAPDGTGSACDAGDPCSLQTALDDADTNGEVALYPGHYPVTATLAVDQGVHLHGIYGQPRPDVVGDPGLTGPTIALRPGTQASYLGVTAKGPGSAALEIDGATGRDLALWANSGARSGAVLKTHAAGSLLVDAMAWAAASPGEAVRVTDPQNAGGSATVLAVTAIGTQGAAAITTASATGDQQVVNAIACGSSDIAAQAGSAPARLSHSNFRTARSSGWADDGGNGHGMPIFRNETGGDFRPVSGSPTIDAGVLDARSTIDPWGVARGIAPDMGAFEHVAGADPAGGGSGLFCSNPDPAPDAGGDTDPAKPSGGSQGQGQGPRGRGQGRPPITPGPRKEEPVMGSTVTLDSVRGNPRVRLPGTKEWVELTPDTAVPVGAVVDATHGMVALTSVRDRSGTTQTGKFWGGIFQVKQSRRDGVTELILKGAMPSCKRQNQVSASRKKKRGGRRLWGSDRGGRFRTRGRNGSATVRGTKWLTEERCKGTYFKVTQGAIDVRAKGRKKPIRLKRGQSRLIKSRR